MSLAHDIQGHWIRDWIKAPGFEDHTTRVHWAQAGLDFADVRIPLDRPDVTQVSALSDLSAGDLALLAQSEGFAGRVTLDGKTCTWHREVNFHGSPSAPDVGAISFDADGRMIETGVLADYTELWKRSAETDPQIIRFAGNRYKGRLVTFGRVGVIGVGRPEKQTTAGLIDALQKGQVPDGIEDLFDGVHATVHWSDGTLIADLATQPFVEGKRLMTFRGSNPVWHRIGFHGEPEDVHLQIETPSAL